MPSVGKVSDKRGRVRPNFTLGGGPDVQEERIGESLSDESSGVIYTEGD